MRVSSEAAVLLPPRYLLTYETAAERVAARSRTTVIMSDPGKEEGKGTLARAWRHLKCGFRCYFAKIFGKG